MERGVHRRLPAVVASMTAAVRTAMAWAVERGAISPAAADEKSAEAWDIFLKLADQQGSRVNEQRPATRFLNALSTLLLQRRVYVIDRGNKRPEEAKQGCEFIGWYDTERYYLDADAVFKEVYAFCLKSGQPLPYRPQAVWADLERQQLLEVRKKDDKVEYTQSFRTGHGSQSKPERGLYLRKRAIDGDAVEQGDFLEVM